LGYLTLRNDGMVFSGVGVVLKLGGSVYRWFGPSYTIPDFKNEASRFK